MAHGPLEALCGLLDRGPPLLSALMMCFGEAQDYAEFVQLVREYLPDLENDVLGAGGPEGMVMAFARLFGERYFPLADHWLEIDEEEGFAGITSFIPVAFNGLSEDDYHFLTDRRAGFLLAALLVDFEREMCLEGEGIRITVMEAVEGTVSRELLERLPGQGYPLGFLRQEVPAGLAGLVRIAEYLCHDTGCCFLDCSSEDVLYDPPMWDRETVEYLTGQWEMHETIDGEVRAFMEWIEESPEDRFRELVRFLERRASGRRARIDLGAAPGPGGATR